MAPVRASRATRAFWAHSSFCDWTAKVRVIIVRQGNRHTSRRITRLIVFRVKHDPVHAGFSDDYGGCNHFLEIVVAAFG